MKVYVVQNIKTKELLFPLAATKSEALYKATGEWKTKDFTIINAHTPKDFSLRQSLYGLVKGQNEKTS